MLPPSLHLSAPGSKRHEGLGWSAGYGRFSPLSRAILQFSAILVLSLIATALAFPAYLTLAGLSENKLDTTIQRLVYHLPEPPPGPQSDTSAKLVNDAAHPWKPLRRGDIRGPCPGLNTLASHGWLPRNGIATPAQIITAVQEGFNMANDLAEFLVYAAHIVDGNLITNRMSIGRKTHLTGPDPPLPATAGGLDTHAVFEGDASMTRDDSFFGDNHSFNETLFEEVSNNPCRRFGAGKYNLTVAGEFRYQRIQDSMATNPNFSFTSPRFVTAYAETVFPILFFIDGRVSDGQLDLNVARGFYQDMKMPEGFFRSNKCNSFDGDLGVGMRQVFNMHPVTPGNNHGVGNYVVDPKSAKLGQMCLLYTNFVNETVRSLYPSPTGALRTALNTNLDFFYRAFHPNSCAQVFPYG